MVILKNMYVKLLAIVVMIFFPLLVRSNLNPHQEQESPKKNNYLYRTSFGYCPSRAAGTLTLKLIKVFEDRGSLIDVKETIIRDGLVQKHFISKYQINYDPLKKLLTFVFDCPKPLMKVQIYKGNDMEIYNAILVENGDLYDPTYEVLLVGEKKLNTILPILALPFGDMDDSVRYQITNLIRNMEPNFRNKLSEVILNENKDLTAILSVGGRPSSVFMGQKNWNEKLLKLKKIVDYMESKNRIPAVINLTNAKKVVVKFNDKF